MMCRAATMVSAALAVFATAGSACAAPASADARATIVEGNGVRMNWATAASSVRGTPDGAAFVGSVPSMMMGMMMMPGNARLTVRRDDDAGVPVTAPASFEVIGTEGDNALTIRTTASSEFRVARDGVILDGALQGGTAVSIDVGRGVMPISQRNATTGPAASTLVVVVQYN